MPTLNVWSVVKRQEGKSFALRSFAIAFTLWLHLSLLIWLTLPPKHLAEAIRDTNDDRPLHVALIKAQPQERASVPPTSRQSSSTQIPVTHAKSFVSLTRVHREPSAPLNQATASDASSSAPVEPRSLPVATAEPPVEAGYGNSRFAKALRDSQTETAIRLPGDEDTMKVAGIHVQTPPSLAQTLKDTGHWLRCKDAVFKSHMTDQELAQRGLTERQMLLKYVEEGCP